ncbi:MAG: hypothetical protein UV78_C0009G0002 [Parcubacteria group bacterium GW2011_GWA2_43_17]|nr:MAG: hypothetical protein UV78_C0009G0002 [Parcubacteria group bacterium GW2011_GWA2_43_17]
MHPRRTGARKLAEAIPTSSTSSVAPATATSPCTKRMAPERCSGCTSTGSSRPSHWLPCGIRAAAKKMSRTCSARSVVRSSEPRWCTNWKVVWLSAWYADPSPRRTATERTRPPSRSKTTNRKENSHGHHGQTALHE